MFVTQKWENKNASIKLVFWSKKKNFNLELVTQTRKNESLTIELVTSGEIKYFSTLS